MGYVFAVSDCFVCKRPFTYNPNLVPSIRVDGVREPVCKYCIEDANPIREKKGLPKIVPLPGAYEPCNEDEL